MRKLFATLLAAQVALAPAHVLASQNSLMSPSTGTVSGLQLTNNLNNALDSLNTANSGPTAPTNQLSGVASLGNFWLNTTSAPYPLGMNDGSSNWPNFGWLDTSNHLWDVQIGGGTASIASATTTDLCNGVPQNSITITGTTTITSFGSSCVPGSLKVVTFAGVLTLTYNGTSLLIPGAANVVTAAGDQAVLVALGSGDWQVVAYTPASGQALINPAVDVGDYLFTSSLTAPSSKYLFAYGQAISRTTYATYLATVTTAQSVTRTTSSPTLTGFTDTSQIASGGAKIEGSGIPAGTTILSCASTTCTMSANATSSGTANVTVFPYGDGDGSTTFNMPNCQGVALAGRDNMSGTPRAALTSTYFGTNPDALGAYGGAQSRTLVQANLGAWSFPVTDPGHYHGTNVRGSYATTGESFSPSGTFPMGVNAPEYGANAEMYSNSTDGSSLAGGATGAPNGFITLSYTGITVASGGSGTPVTTVQPSLTANCMIRVLSFLMPGEMPVVPVGDNHNRFAAIEPRRLAA